MADAGERLSKLLEMLKRQPDEPFLLYAIALEHKRAGRLHEALAYLAKVLDSDERYCVAYHQRGLIYERLGDVEAARQAYRQGIELARSAGDQHAATEMQAAFDLLQ